jgi:Zn-finger nucleic acid-binding protein
MSATLEDGEINEAFEIGIDKIPDTNIFSNFPPVTKTTATTSEASDLSNNHNNSEPENVSVIAVMTSETSFESELESAEISPQKNGVSKTSPPSHVCPRCQMNEIPVENPLVPGFQFCSLCTYVFLNGRPVHYRKRNAFIALAEEYKNDPDGQYEEIIRRKEEKMLQKKKRQELYFRSINKF